MASAQVVLPGNVHGKMEVRSGADWAVYGPFWVLSVVYMTEIHFDAFWETLIFGHF